MKRLYLLFVSFCIFSFLISCNISSFDYNNSAQDIVYWLYTNYGDNNNFDVTSVSFVDDENSEYIFYTVGFEMDYDTLTDEGIITGQGTIIYCVLRHNPTISVKFNINDSDLHQELYDEYLSAKENNEAYSNSYFPNEIDDMLIKAANNN